MFKPKPVLLAAAVTAATLLPAAAANAGLIGDCGGVSLPNHNETLLLDA